MSSRRRRADNFTDSLFSFRQASDTEYSQTSEMYSEDSLNTDFVTNGQCGNDKHNCPNNIKCHGGSIILANNSTKEQYISSSDAYHTAEEESYDIPCSDIQPQPSHVLDETSYIPIKFDLNKCINLFHNEYLEKERETCEEYSSVSTTSSKTKVKEVGPCHSNTGTTVKASNHEKVETIVPSVNAISLSESSVSSSKKDDLQSIGEDQKYNSTSGGSTVDDIDPCELKTLLHSLENQQKPPREMPNQEHMLRRLSTIFYVSPSDFTERLLTIIEESIITNDSDMREFQDVSLRRLTAELRQMCKLIDNETVPEWPASPGTSICAEEGGGQPKPDFSRRSLGILPSPRKSLRTISSPISSTISRNSKSPRKIFRRTPKTISAALNKTQSPLYESTNVHDNTSTFEYLEAYCKKLFPDEYKPSPQQKNRLQSPLRNMNSILHMCNTQMASLEDSFSVREPVRNVATSTSNPTSQHNTAPKSFQHDLIIFSPDKHKKTLLKSVSPMQCAARRTRCEIIEPDDLQKTLIYEIAKKRQRCLDTAKIIMEIDGISEPLEAQGTCPINKVNEARLSTEKDAKLMETLMSCKQYQEYLVEYRPLLNLLQRSESCKSRSTQSKKNVRTKEANKLNVATLAVPKSSATKGKTSRSPSPKTFAVPKPKLFITPGKTPTKRTVYREKRTYFRDVGVNPNKQENLKKSSSKEPNISPCAQSICRKMGLNYDSVMSPVGMYIKGTNPHLIKNLRPKTNEMLLTPRRKQPTPSVNTKPEMKFRLSPKQPRKTLTSTAAGDENVPDNFLHPKVHYKLPSYVRTIKETENRKVGNRINELLRSTQDKVVIRHEGRTKTVQTDCLEQPEIHYDSAEESVHIEQTARKTHFSRVQKGH